MPHELATLFDDDYYAQELVILYPAVLAIDLRTVLVCDTPYPQAPGPLFHSVRPGEICQGFSIGLTLAFRAENTLLRRLARKISSCSRDPTSF